MRHVLKVRELFPALPARVFLALGILSAASLCPSALAAQEGALGYRVLSDRILIQSAEDWRAWTAATGSRLIDERGTVLPRLLRRDTNAIVNAEQDTLLASISGARSGQESATLAANVLDGDMDTYWEPDPDAPLANWGFEIDLGRAVVARSIVLRFAAEGQGDPFLKFRVLISDGLSSFGRNRRLQFFRAGLVTQPNKDQRVFTFDLETRKKAPEDIEGAVIQFIRIDVLDTDGPRGAEVSQDEYGDLADEERGAIDYILLTAAGREITVTQDVYTSLPVEERGPIRYFRRERPRLAEVEVPALGENIVAITQSEKEKAPSQGRFAFRLFRILTDGLFSSSLDVPAYDPVADEGQVEIDLGAKYWLDRIKLLSPDNPPFAYQVRISDGAADPRGNLIWTSFTERQNLERYLHVEERFPLQEIRFIELRHLQIDRSRRARGKLSEVQAFGAGFVSEVTMTSPFIFLDRPRIFSALTWDGEVPPDTRVEVRTRTGDKVTLVPHYFTGFDINAREISRELWEKIPENTRPPEVIEEVTGPDWSNWSDPYEGFHEPFKSPSPRPLVRAQVKLVSRNPVRAASIRRLQLHVDPPLVDAVLAEVWPAWGVEPGVEQTFTLYLRPLFVADNPGFDRLRLRSGSSAPVELISVRVGTDSQLNRGTARPLWPGSLLVQTGDEGDVRLDFPDPVNGDAQSREVYELRFRTRVFLQSTAFSVELGNSRRPRLVQQARSGNATARVASQSLVVISDLESGSLLEDVSVSPPVLTPNGDGVNDEAVIRFSVFHLETGKTLGVGIYDLAGRRLRDLSTGRSRPSGQHRIPWDGRDDAGAVVPPGVYLARIRLALDRDDQIARTTRLIHVAY